MNKQLNRRSEELIIDDILDIRAGNYPNYKYYLDVKQRLCESIIKMNQRNFENTPFGVSYSYYITPYIISEEAFNYIISRGLRMRRSKKKIVVFRKFYSYKELYEFFMDYRLIEFLDRENDNTLKVVYCKGVYYATLYTKEEKQE